MGLTDKIHDFFFSGNGKSYERGFDKGCSLESVLVKEAGGRSDEDLRLLLMQPEVLPCVFDKTFEAWLYRIGIWGKINFLYQDNGRRKRITQGEFLKMMQANNMINAFGSWEVKKTGYKSVRFERDFKDREGKRHKERIDIDIDLKPSIKQAMKMF